MKVIVYSRQLCDYCTKAKELLAQRAVEVEEIDCSFSGALVNEMIQKSHGRNTFPQIFINGIHVGGYDDLVVLDEMGTLPRP